MTTYIYKSTTGFPVNTDTYVVTVNPGLQTNRQIDVLDALIGTSIARYDDGILQSADTLIPAYGTGTSLNINGINNQLFQPSSKYMTFIPGQQFIGSGTAAKDKSGKAADAGFLASLTEANAYANPGYITTGAGVNLGLAIPASKIQFDLATESIIFSCRIKKVGPVGAEAFVGCADASTIQGFYLSMRAASGSVSKVRPIINTSGGVVSGLADSAATFGEASATDHVITLMIDAVTKSVFLYCDGTLSNSYPSAYTGGTTVTVPFGFGFNTGTSGVTTVTAQFSGIHFLKMTGSLPLNAGTIAQKLSATPHLYLTDSDLVF